MISARCAVLTRIAGAFVDICISACNQAKLFSNPDTAVQVAYWQPACGILFCTLATSVILRVKELQRHVTRFTVGAGVSQGATARVRVHSVSARPAVLTRSALAFVDIYNTMSKRVRNFKDTNIPTCYRQLTCGLQAAQSSACKRSEMKLLERGNGVMFTQRSTYWFRITSQSNQRRSCTSKS